MTHFVLVMKYFVWKKKRTCSCYSRKHSSSRNKGMKVQFHNSCNTFGNLLLKNSDRIITFLLNCLTTLHTIMKKKPNKFTPRATLFSRETFPSNKPIFDYTMMKSKNGLLLGIEWSFILHHKMLFAKFGWNWPGGFGEVFNVWSYYRWRILHWDLHPFFARMWPYRSYIVKMQYFFNHLLLYSWS